MNKQIPMCDLRRLTPRRLITKEFSHILMLLYWPVFGLLFYYVERVYPVTSYHEMMCSLDNYIPFNELFVIPYMLWFVFLIFIHLYTVIYDTSAFRGLMRYIMISYTLALVIFFVFPTSQMLRPEEFARDNPLTRFMAGFYKFDTNTNVCPSLHVVGSLAVLSTTLNCERFKTTSWRSFFIISAVLISVSTVFLKQHSVIDLIVALPICAISYYFAFYRPLHRR